MDFKKLIGEYIHNSSFVGCVVIDRKANMLYTNDVFDNLVRGIDGSVEGENLINVLREDEKESINQFVETLFEKGNIPKTEWEIINRLDEKLYLDFEGSLIEIDDQKFGIAHIIDKSEERALKQELEYSNSQRELAINTGKLGIWKLNLETNYLEWNDILLDIYELTREEWEADLDGWQKMVYEEDSDSALQELAKAFTGEYVFDVGFRIKTQSGKIKHINASAGPFFDEEGKVTEVHGVNIDVTNLVEAEAEAIEREQYFKNITDKLPGLVVQYYINPDGSDGINYLSKGVEELYGISHTDASKNVGLIWERVLPEDVPAVTASLQNSAANLSDWECTFRIHDYDGNLKHIQCKGTPDIGEGNRITWDTIALDVTEKVQLNEAIKAKQQQIENITDKIPGVVLQYYIDKDGNDGLNYLSDGVKKVYGLDKEEALKNVNLIWERVLPEYLPKMAESIQYSAETLEDWDIVFEATHVDGTRKFLRGFGTPHKGENGTIIWDTLTLDITKQVVQEKEIQDKSIQLENFTDQIPGVALRYYLKPDGSDGFKYLSKGSEDIYDIDRDAAIKDSSILWDKIYHDDLALFKESIFESAEHLTKWEVIHRIITEKGTKYLNSAGIPRKEEDGTIIWDTISMDITKQIESEAAVRESQEMLDKLTDQVPGLVYIYQLDPQGNDHLLFLNSGIEDIFEINRDEALIDLSLIWNSVHPDDIELLQTSIIESANTLSKWNCVYRILPKSGKLKYIQGSGTPTKLNDGTIQWYSIGVDITQQIESETAIRESEQMLDNLTNQVPSMVYIYQLLQDGTAIFTYQNSAVEEIFEIPKEESFRDLSLVWNCIHPDDVESLSSQIQTSADELEPWSSIYRIITPSGKLKYIQGTGTPEKLRDGTVQWYTVGIDITKEKEQELKLLENRKHLNVIADHFPGVIYTYLRKPDGTENLTYLSKGVESIHGIDIKAAYNDSMVMWSLVHPDDMPNFLASVEKSASEVTVWEYTFRVRIKSGEYHWFQGYGKPTLLDDGSILWTSITFDIHEQVVSRKESQLQKEQLESITNKIQGVVLKYQVHPDGTDSIPYISTRVLEYWGVDAETVTSDISKAWERVVAEDVEITRKAIQKSIDTMTEWSQIMRFISRTGEIKHLQGYSIPKLLDNGTVEFDTVMIDVTDQEIAKQDVKEKERQLEVLGDQIPGVVFVYYRNPDGSDGFSYFSDGFEDLHGFDKSKALENPKLLWQQVYPADLPNFVSAIMESGSQLSKFDVQYRITRPDGKTRYLHGFGTPNRKEDGTVIWNAVNLDITDRKLAETEIAETSEQLKSITNQVPGVVVRYQLLEDGSDRILFISDGVSDIYGITKEEAKADSSLIWSRYHEDDIEELQESIQRSAELLVPWEHIYRYYTKQGDIGYLQGFGTPHKMEDGTVIWDAITLDITKRMQAEVDANRSNSKLRAFIESSPIAIYQIDPNGNVTDFWNAAAEQVYGWTHEEVIYNTLPSISNENHDEFVEIIEDIRISKKPKQFLVHRKNRYNEDIILEITAGPLFDENDKLTDLLIIANDITELQEYRKTLESALREKEILLQEIHHRVKNNLAIVSGLLELQAMKDDNEHDMSLIIEARNRIHSIAMVHEQLYQDMDFSHINPSDYYKKLLKKLQANTTSAERDINYDLKFDLDKININRAVPLGLLINELFTNSIKHAFSDGTGNLKLYFSQTGDKINVYYEDDGPGFVIEEIQNKNTIGWQLIETLLLQLDSTYTMDTKGRFMLDFTFEETMQGSQSHFS